MIALPVFKSIVAVFPLPEIVIVLFTPSEPLKLGYWPADNVTLESFPTVSAEVATITKASAAWVGDNSTSPKSKTSVPLKVKEKTPAALVVWKFPPVEFARASL